MTNITPYHAKYFAHYLTRRLPANNVDKLTASLHDAQVDLTPHQIDAALFAFKSPLSNGAILADEVGLGKTIEAGIILSQHWAEHKRRLLIICPANLRKQWSAELLEKFFLPSYILEAKSFNQEIETGNLNPFEKDGIVICSYQFASKRASYLRHTEWDLVVIDEAHRLRNVYKPNNRIGNTIKNALLKRKKVLLTATPLQNSILELYGLVSIIDEFVFGDVKSFKSQFSKILTENDYRLLRNRLQPVCKRTLRRQVLEYIQYTKRIAICEEYYPTDNEQRLYELVSTYLQRPHLYALPNSQRQLMTMILRKLLASSTFAIYGTLTRLIERLEEILRQQNVTTEFDATTLDFDGLDDNLDYWVTDDEEEVGTMAAEAGPEELLHPHDIEGIKNELADLREFQALAAKIRKNSKAEHLFVALNKGFEELERLGANRKALLFTESRRTQDFLFELFEKNGYKGKVVLFNGSNGDKQSAAIYKAWLEKHKGSSKVTGSATADKRAALVEYFRDHATIMIATEAAAEGINLQFCSLVVNYDMPWNPQRIEQRIGRCHRYGQKHDVVVINFLNKRNAADVRVYELLNEKFQLFSGVFGASDEVLGSIGNGVDFEKRITQIYNECRTTEEIEQAFDQLQEELHAEISGKILKARSTLLENFDESVSEKLKIHLAESIHNLNLFEKRLWELTKYDLGRHASFNESTHSFIHENGETYCMVVPKDGKRKSDVLIPDHAQIYRIGHPLAQSILKRNQVLDLPSHEVVFDYTHTPVKVALLERQVGHAGWMRIEKFTIKASEPEDYLLVACYTDDGHQIPSEIAERMFSFQAKEGRRAQISSEMADILEQDIRKQKEVAKDENYKRNQQFFETEIEKLNLWADDVKIGLEREISDLDAEIKLRKAEARKLSRLEEKIEAQRQVKDLEKCRSEKRRSLFEAQDEVDAQKEKLFDEVEQTLRQKKATEETLFTIRWRIV
ncbi:MAG: DEAD/DEAH box helicase family protein [Prevotella sp.]|nr:DEAD/DEAH box helicase family protein [Prevotella sp.]